MRSCQQVPISQPGVPRKRDTNRPAEYNTCKAREFKSTYDRSMSLILAEAVEWTLPWYELYASVYFGTENGLAGSVTW